MKEEKRTLIKNTVMLYIMRFSMFFFAFLTTPYLTRVLGVEYYGKVGVANALMMYFFYVVDFGFILSGTQAVAEADSARNKRLVSEIYTAIQVLKVGLSILSFIILGAIFWASPIYREDALFYSLFLLSTVVNGFIPSHIFRGIQEMKSITTVVLISQTIYLVTVFLFVKSPTDYILIPILKTLGELFALLFSIFQLRRNYGIKLVPIRFQDIKDHMSASATFFLSRIAGTVYNNFNILILNQLSSVAAGLYTVPNKLISTGQSALSPISDSIYPYMTQNKDFKLIKRILLYGMPPIIIGCVGVSFFAEEFTALIFGAEFYASGPILRALMPVAIMSLPQLMLGFPTMSALGITEYANYSIYFSSAIHLVILAGMWTFDLVTPLNLAYLVSLTTFIDLMYRLYHIRKRVRVLRAQHAEGLNNEE